MRDQKETVKFPDNKEFHLSDLSKILVEVGLRFTAEKELNTDIHC